MGSFEDRGHRNIRALIMYWVFLVHLAQLWTHSQVVTAQNIPSSQDEIKFHDPQQFRNQQQQPPAHQDRQKRRGGSPSRHSDLHMDLNKERDHMKQHVKEDYLDMDALDDVSLLMQYFKKHDTDGNYKLDGLELLKAMSAMSDEDHHHGDYDTEGMDAEDILVEREQMPVSDLMHIVDDILQDEDKDNDGYITWPEFLTRQRRKSPDQPLSV